MHWFFYGSLRDPDVLALVLGPAAAGVEMQPARLPGHAARRLAGTPYPVLHPQPDSFAVGVLARGLGSEAEARLAWYEGPGYRRGRVRVQVEGGGTCPAAVWLPLGAAAATAVVWRLEDWQRREKPRLLRGVERRMRLWRPPARPASDGSEA